MDFSQTFLDVCALALAVPPTPREGLVPSADPLWQRPHGLSQKYVS